MRTSSSVAAAFMFAALTQAGAQPVASPTVPTLVTANSRVVLQAPDSTLWPEGADYDARTGAWYLSSVRHGTVVKVDARGVAHALWNGDSLRVGAVMGVRVDTARGYVWATASGIPQRQGFAAGDTAIAALLRIRLRDGGIDRMWDLPVVPRGHVLGDLTIGPNGDVFISDSYHPTLFRLRPGSDSLETLTSPLFKSLQGLAATPDGRTLYLADYSRGLIRLDLATGVFTLMDDAARPVSRGCDGIMWYRGSIIAVQNGVAPARIVRFYLDAKGTGIDRAEVIDRNISVADEPTIGTIVGDEFVYVANSQWEKYDAKGARRPGIPLTSPILLGVSLKSPPT